MILQTLSLILILSELKDFGSYASTSRRTKLADHLAEDHNIKSADIARIKKFLHNMNRYGEDARASMKDPTSYCQSFDNCYECVKSIWFPCGWCHNYGCTENPEKMCPFAEPKAEKSNITGDLKICPYVQHEGPILVPGGVRINIKVKVYIPDPVINEKEILCQIKIKDRLSHLKGLIMNDVVYCYPIVLQTEATRLGETDTGSLRLIWGGAQPYSNEIPLIVYSCENLGVDCESCRLIPNGYACGWCDEKYKCVIADKCPNDMMKWTLNRLTCKNFDATESYCASLSSCWDCKKSGTQCDWCHDIGCTHYPTLHCPQKVFLDNAWHKNSLDRFCTEIVSSDPIFVPANIRRFIKLNLRIDDLTLYKRKIICDIHIEQAIVRVKGSIGQNTLFCDMTTLRITRSVALGYVRLLWGGAEPYSNMILLVVYRCEYMATNCMECQALDRRFNCGWCEETSNCILLEECPRQSGPWIDKKSLCGKYRGLSYHTSRGSWMETHKLDRGHSQFVNL